LYISPILGINNDSELHTQYPVLCPLAFRFPFGFRDHSSDKPSTLRGPIDVAGPTPRPSHRRAFALSADIAFHLNGPNQIPTLSETLFLPRPENADPSPRRIVQAPNFLPSESTCLLTVCAAIAHTCDATRRVACCVQVRGTLIGGLLTGRPLSESQTRSVKRHASYSAVPASERKVLLRNIPARPLD
jgi:hypothetical protein